MKNLLEYIKGVRRGKPAHNLEREAMQDPFLQDALEGYDLVGADPIDTIKRLQNKILQKTQKKKSYLSYYYIAASILIVFFIGSYFLVYNSDKDKPTIAYQSTQKEQPPKAVDSQDTENNVNIEESAINSTEEKKYDTHVFTPKKTGKSHKPKEKIRHNPETQSIAFEDNSKYWEQTPSAEGIAQKDIMVRSSPSLGRSLEKKESGYFSMKGRSSNPPENADRTESGKPAESLAVAASVSGINIKDRSENKKDSIISGNLSADQLVYDANPVIGRHSYNQYLKDHVSIAEENTCIQSKESVLIHFSVSDSGRPYNIEVIKSLCPELNEQIIELIKNGADWKGARGQIQFPE